MLELTLGSFFDGIGGWLLAATNAGIKPIWASEIDPFPASVTAKHFPDVKQLGDITKIDVNELKPADIICAGSPCQDLSVAGKREGLEGERSGLFHTAIKLVHGLRDRTGKPRFFVWENVPGAFSSNKGFDFKAVLEEIGQTEVPMPSNGRWATAGLAELPECDIAWRVLDAQYWGVPQRRKRIFLVADFGKSRRCAGEILFVEQGVSGDTTESRSKAQGTTAEAKGSAGNTSQGVDVEGIDMQGGKHQSKSFKNIVPTMATTHGDMHAIIPPESIGIDLYNMSSTGDKASTVTTRTGQYADASGPSILENTDRRLL